MTRISGTGPGAESRTWADASSTTPGPSYPWPVAARTPAGLDRFTGLLDHPGESIGQNEEVLGKAVDAMGSAAGRSRLEEWSARLLGEDRSRLDAREEVGLVAWREDLEARTEAARALAKERLEPVMAGLRTVDHTAVIAEIERGTPWKRVRTFPSGIHFKKKATGPCEFEESGGDFHYLTFSGLEDDLPYRYRVELALGDRTVSVRALDGAPDGVVSATSRPDWFAPDKLNMLITVIFLTVILLVFIRRARLNPNLFIRRIAGLNAVEDALDRATELGRSIYFVIGPGYMSDLPTIAAVGILERVARRAARNDLRIIVPCWDPVVMSVAQDVVREAYLKEGRSPARVKEDVFFVSDDRFSYAAAVDGFLLRDKPSTTFFMGAFQAESLLMTEVGSTLDAVQISGTDQPSQLPFFVTTTDHTLIGEELYAAGAYLSRDALLLGSLRGQDIGKIVLAGAILAGAILTTLGIDVIWKFFA